MELSFDDEQRLFQSTLRDFLEGECTPEQVRAGWETETGRSASLWSSLAEIGIPGARVSEEHGGLGLDEIDLILLLEETGRAALAEPVISTAAVAAPLLQDLGQAELAGHWLPRIVRGEAIVAVGHAQSPFVSDAHVAALLLLTHGDEIHAVDPGQTQRTRQLSNDPSRRLFSVEWSPSSQTRVADAALGRQLQAEALDRGALACAAEQIGVCQKLIDLAVAYAVQRKQFGVQIGSFQAVKHQLANLKVQLEYARPLVYRAAHSVARRTRHRSLEVSMAKSAASEAAVAAARVALQVHGALGYTWEQDLHIWMRRAWSLELAWGSGSWHRARVADRVIDGDGQAGTFGYSSPAYAPAQ